MFGFGKSSTEKARNEFRTQFLSMVDALNKGDQEARNYLGLTIMSAYQLFATINASSDQFCRKSIEEQKQFISMLDAIGQKALDERNDKLTFFGFTLVQMWVEAAARQDHELMKLFSKKLAQFTIGGPPTR